MGFSIKHSLRKADISKTNQYFINTFMPKIRFTFFFFCMMLTTIYSLISRRNSTMHYLSILAMSCLLCIQYYTKCCYSSKCKTQESNSVRLTENKSKAEYFSVITLIISKIFCSVLSPGSSTYN